MAQKENSMLKVWKYIYGGSRIDLDAINDDLDPNEIIGQKWI